MRTNIMLTIGRVQALTLAVALTATAASARPTPPPDQHQHAQPGAASDNAFVANEIAQLRARIAKLELTIARDKGGMPNGMTMNDEMEMGMGGSMGNAAAKMNGKTMAMPGGCCGDMMGKMGADGSAAATMRSNLPGFPGASHVYHIGATGYFLDHPEAIMLNPQQQAALNGIKERSIVDQAALERKIDQAEQELWMLTSSDQPDSTAVETKVRDIERLKGDQRIAFIRSVGEAARVLTNEQRAALLGTNLAAGPPASPDAMKPPAGSGSMGDDDDAMGKTGGMGHM